MQAEIVYTQDTGEKLVFETFGPNNMHRRAFAARDPHRVAIRDGRSDARDFTLEANGFEFVAHRSAMEDFFDAPALKNVYYREVADLVQRVSGARRVHVFDHTLRSGDEAEREARLIRDPVVNAHNDYTDWSGPNRLREVLPDEAEALLARRFAIIQVWRPIAEPIRANPLAVADAASVAPQDLLVAERRYPNRVGQTYSLRWNPAHRWFWFPEMTRDEAIVFKVYDSATDGRARFTPHTSFELPGTEGAPPRRSIEARAFAFF